MLSILSHIRMPILSCKVTWTLFGCLSSCQLKENEKGEGSCSVYTEQRVYKNTERHTCLYPAIQSQGPGLGREALIE